MDGGKPGGKMLGNLGNRIKQQSRKTNGPKNSKEAGTPASKQESRKTNGHQNSKEARKKEIKQKGRANSDHASNKAVRNQPPAKQRRRKEAASENNTVAIPAIKQKMQKSIDAKNSKAVKKPAIKHKVPVKQALHKRLSNESHVLLKAERGRRVAGGEPFGRVRAATYLSCFGEAHSYGKASISTALNAIYPEGRRLRCGKGEGPQSV